MNLKLINIFAAALLVTSCKNNSSKQPATADTTEKEATKIQVPRPVCYTHISGKDTIHLKLEFFPNVVTGRLVYHFSEKDGGSGDIDGKLFGDTLIADYTFMSEGKSSIRQVAFLVKDSTATEGYGPVQEKDGKMVFISPAQVDFSKGTTLVKTACNE